MTDTTYTSRLLGSAWPGHFNKVIAETMYENIKKVGLPTWSDADQQLAKGLQAELKVRVNGLPTKILPLRAPRVAPAGGDEEGSGRWTESADRRRVRRYRRHFLERADGGAALSVEHSGRAGSQLGERSGHGDADRA